MGNVTCITSGSEFNCGFFPSSQLYRDSRSEFVFTCMFHLVHMSLNSRLL